MRCVNPAAGDNNNQQHLLVPASSSHAAVSSFSFLPTCCGAPPPSEGNGNLSGSFYKTNFQPALTAVGHANHKNNRGPIPHQHQNQRDPSPQQPRASPSQPAPAAAVVVAVDPPRGHTRIATPTTTASGKKQTKDPATMHVHPSVGSASTSPTIQAKDEDIGVSAELSQRQLELQALRSKKLAKAQREKFQDHGSSPLFPAAGSDATGEKQHSHQVRHSQYQQQQTGEQYYPEEEVSSPMAQSHTSSIYLNPTPTHRGVDTTHHQTRHTSTSTVNQTIYSGVKPQIPLPQQQQQQLQQQRYDWRKPNYQHVGPAEDIQEEHRNPRSSAYLRHVQNPSEEVRDHPGPSNQPPRRMPKTTRNSNNNAKPGFRRKFQDDSLQPDAERGLQWCIEDRLECGDGRQHATTGGGTSSRSSFPDDRDGDGYFDDDDEWEERQYRETTAPAEPRRASASPRRLRQGVVNPQQQEPGKNSLHNVLLDYRHHRNSGEIHPPDAKQQHYHHHMLHQENSSNNHNNNHRPLRNTDTPIQIHQEIGDEFYQKQGQFHTIPATSEGSGSGDGISWLSDDWMVPAKKSHDTRKAKRAKSTTMTNALGRAKALPSSKKDTSSIHSNSRMPDHDEPLQNQDRYASTTDIDEFGLERRRNDLHDTGSFASSVSSDPYIYANKKRDDASTSSSISSMTCDRSTLTEMSDAIKPKGVAALVAMTEKKHHKGKNNGKLLPSPMPPIEEGKIPFTSVTRTKVAFGFPLDDFEVDEEEEEEEIVFDFPTPQGPPLVNKDHDKLSLFISDEFRSKSPEHSGTTASMSSESGQRSPGQVEPIVRQPEPTFFQAPQGHNTAGDGWFAQWAPPPSNNNSESPNHTKKIKRQKRPPTTLATVQEARNEDRSESANWCWICLAIFITMCIGVAGVYLLVGGSLLAPEVATPIVSNTAEPDLFPPTNSPTSFGDLVIPTYRLDSFRQLLGPLSGSQTMRDATTPQYAAMEWLANKDPSQLDPTDTPLPIILQRYVIVLLYFATDGRAWNQQYNFLSSGSVCNWNDQDAQSSGWGGSSDGIRCDSQDVVIQIVLPDNHLNGDIPWETAMLNQLQVLYLPGNQQLGGSIPTQFGYLTNLRHVDLSMCQLQGNLPTELASLTQLQQLDVGSNHFDGNLPSELGKLDSLQVLKFGDNQFQGSLPSELGQLTNLRHFSAFANHLDGTVPERIGALTSLEVLNLRSNNFHGDLDAAFCNGSQQYSQFWADCGAGSTDLICTCCTHCCNAVTCCNQASTVAAPGAASSFQCCAIDGFSNCNYGSTSSSFP